MNRLDLNKHLSLDVSAVSASLIAALRKALRLPEVEEGQADLELILAGDASRPTGEWLTGNPLLSRDGVDLFVQDEMTLFRLGQSLAWCRAGESRGFLSMAPNADADAVAALVLVPLLGELALSAGQLLMHAAAFGRDGPGMLLPAASGSGKTTLFQQAADAGWQVLSDDLAWLQPEDKGALIMPCHRGLAPSNGGPKSLPLSLVVFPEIAEQVSVRYAEFDERLKRLVDQAGFSGNRASSEIRFRMLVRLAARLPGYVLQAGPSGKDNLALLDELVQRH